LKTESSKISAVIITYNEESNIERCLKSLAGIVDEIIIVDSFSKDETETICKKYNAQFHQRKFAGYSDQKNWGNAQAKHNFILSLDADEALDETLRTTILNLKPNLKQQAYSVNRKNFLGDKWLKYGGWYPDKKVRLFHKEAAQWDGKVVHETVAVNSGYATSLLKGDLLHYSFGSVADHLLTINKYSGIRVDRKMAKGKGYSLFGAFANAKFKAWKILFLKMGILDGKVGRKAAYNSGLRHIIEFGIYKKRISTAQDSETICLFNTTPFWGGGEKWHFDTATFLQEKGKDIKFVTASKGELKDKVKKASLPLAEINTGNLSFLNPFKIRKIVKYFKSNKINTVIFNGSTDIKVGGIAAFIAGVPNVIYRRGLAKAPKGSHFNIFLFTSVVTHFIANSKSTFSLLCEKTGLPKSKVKHTIIYNVVPTEKYDNLPTSTKDEDTSKFVSIGIASRLVPQKSLHYAIEIAKVLKEKGIRFQLNIAGKGPLENDLKKQITEFNLSTEVRLLGFVEDIPSFMNAQDIYLCTSIFEGFGFSMAEAMLAKKPVVAFDTSSNGEVVQNEETGYIIPAFDIDKAVSCILNLANNSDLQSQMGEKGNEYVRTHFSKENQGAKLLKLLEKG